MKLNRRFLLRGMFQGSAVAMALPLLDCFLDGNGQAFADTGERIPTRFVTFFYGLGLTNKLWIPTNDTGAQKASETREQYLGRLASYGTPPQLAALEPYKKKSTLFSGLRVPLDDNPNFQHYTGAIASTTGAAPAAYGAEWPGISLDQIVAGSIGKTTRFKSVEITCSGNKNECYSSLGGTNKLTPEVSPHDLYVRLFGPGFQDPSKGNWTPDPQIMMEQSVLSAVAEDRKRVMQSLGASDRARMDAYFSAVRDSEQQMTAELQPPKITAKVDIPQDPGDMAVSRSVPELQKIVPVVAKLGAIGLATDQTRVFNVTLSDATSTIFMPGDSKPYHQSSHEEAVDAALGYQPTCAKFATYCMELYASLLKELDGVKEGDGTLLDHGLVYAFTDTSYAKIHALDGIPVMLAGGANGRLRTGLHVAAAGEPVSRVGLTIQQALGLQVDKWGKGSLETNKPFSDILV